MDVRCLNIEALDDLDRLFSCNRSSDHCRCMWFIKPVKAFHADGASGNWQDFAQLTHSSELPLGLLAYTDGAAVGWCALGPRCRYVRAIKTPTYRGRDPDEDDKVWLVPCLFVHPEMRRQGLTRVLVESAVGIARELGASAVEAFPCVDGKGRSGDMQVGFASVFAERGFQAVHSPSSSRRVMRLEL